MNKQLKYIAMSFVIFFCTTQTHPGPYTSRIKKLVHTIETKGPHKKDKYQKKVLEELKSKHTTPPDIATLPLIINLFSFGKNYPIVANNQKTLERSVYQFKNVPGFQETLLTFLRHLNLPETAKGYLYEVQRAVALHDAYGLCDPIKAFNAHLSVTQNGVNCSRQFDLITQNFRIECKDRDFDQLPVASRSSRQIRKQLLAQRDIVETYNEECGTNIAFQLSSKQPLPIAWQEWLCENSIDFFEGVQESPEA